MTKGFALYILSLTAFVFGYTVFLTYLPGSPMGSEVFLVDIAYLALIFAFIFFQVPLRVVRENDRLLMVYCCGTRAIPIESIIEIRAVRRRRDCRGSFRFKYPNKCFWGYPTNLERNIVVVTNTRCNNYFFCLKELDEFIADNWPEGQGGAGGTVDTLLQPATVGQPVGAAPGAGSGKATELAEASSRA